MKRILIAIAIGFLLVTVYMIVTSIIFVLSGQNISIVPYLDLPVRLPKIIIYYFSPPIAEDFTTEPTPRKLVLGLFAYIGNIFIYSVISYIFLVLFSKRRKDVEFKEIEPPPPPSFL